MRRLGWALAILGMACVQAAAADPYLFDVIKQPAYAKTLTGLLDSAGKLPNWTLEVRKTRGDYVGSPAVRVAVDGTTYEIFHACKPHECPDHQLVVMFAPNGVQAWGGLREDKKPVAYFGSPSDAQKTALTAGFSP